LTREFFDREYIGAGKNLRQLEADTGIPSRFLSQVAREHGITVTGTRGPAPAGPGRLHEPDVTGPQPGTGSPAEPVGQIPGDIGRAAQNSPAGWQRHDQQGQREAAPMVTLASLFVTGTTSRPAVPRSEIVVPVKHELPAMPLAGQDSCDIAERCLGPGGGSRSGSTSSRRP